MEKKVYEDDLPFGGRTQWYKYECERCGNREDVEDVVVDAYFYSKGCKVGEYPELTCPECNGSMKCIGSYETE